MRKVFAALLACASLAACGGGECDAECLRDHNPVNCKSTPEKCI